MLAIRTQSLSFDCIIGVYESTTENIRPLVDRSYVTMLMEIGNERMRQNAEKMQRLQKEIESSLKDNDGNCARRKGKKGADWEDAELRKQRLREEGLRRKEEIRRERESREAESTEPVSNTDDEI